MFSFVVPVDTFVDDITPVALLIVTGSVTVVAGGNDGGEVGITVTLGATGAAVVEGVSTLAGESTLLVSLTCTDEGGRSVQLAVTLDITDKPITLMAQLRSTTVEVGQPLSIPIPADTYSGNLHNTTLLNVTGSVTLTSGGLLGGAVGIGVVPGALGEARVEGVSTLGGGGLLRAHLACQDPDGSTLEHGFNITVTRECPLLPSVTAWSQQ